MRINLINEVQRNISMALDNYGILFSLLSKVNMFQSIDDAFVCCGLVSMLPLLKVYTWLSL
ncbi:hypothetical protein L195_g006787 [Trifolium pratense]|uniref:Uncharacterized protein n=1 Tax=Trifolium pratense TaxID=57577 RepID=A0A2K3P4K9_TRIPR|nr:hypothetical protein L195_g006787 [Trifolium pratense]